MNALPEWLRNYQPAWLTGDITAGVIVSVMLIPQGLAYALLAGLPPEMGLYAGILPLIAYAVLGSSMTLAIGPVAVTSLMTASALQPLATSGSPEYAVLAIHLALISGAMLLVFGLLRLGFLAYFLSHPVISGFISGSAILIAVGQLKYVLGIKVDGTHVLEILWALLRGVPQSNPVALFIGVGSMVFLLWARRYMARALTGLGLPATLSGILAKLAPVLAVFAACVVVGVFRLDATAGVSVVGHVPQGLPSFSLSVPGMHALGQLWLPALLITLVGFVESVSIAQSAALKRQERIQPNRELLGLGVANVASAVSGGYAVTGGFARSVVNFEAGAHTPLAGVIAAVLLALVIATLTGLFYYLPHAVLAATIIVSVISLVDSQTLKEAWQYDRADALSLLATALGVLLLGVEAGILIGVALSLGALVWRSSRPHMAVVGRVPGTEHFRNIERHAVQTQPGLLALRVDENLFFANAAVVEEKIESLLKADPALRRVLLICSAVNQIDATALGVLTHLERSLDARGMVLLLAEVKGPVMDRLRSTELGQRLQGKVFLSVHEAFLHSGQFSMESR
ncbi:MAG: sulfate permease [Gammaproteobacteria bacterium]|nr:sulfate permease [Gammaproteobacteria bacterium]MBU0787790.1 sulfate permease [Gammaproteobacteria bacterium]MBU0817091.1 sulfate permease [Gammaproteobacteria bacterium]MBU1787255.1 sulfate permease [Gammaproteobacteria bacterium]